MTDTAVQACLQGLRDAFVHAGLPAKAVRHWPTGGASRPVSAQSLAVRAQLEGLSFLAPPSLACVVKRLAAAQGELQWGQTYCEPEVSGEFLDNYGWAEIVGRKGPIASNNAAIGVLVLGPNTTYPPHSHPAEEYYLPLAGAAGWYRECDGWRTRAPGDLIYHHSNIVHGVRTSEPPLLAAYMWLGRLDEAATLT